MSTWQPDSGPTPPPNPRPGPSPTGPAGPSPTGPAGPGPGRRPYAAALANPEMTATGREMNVYAWAWSRWSR